jgi:hypothetical protein
VPKKQINQLKKHLNNLAQACGCWIRMPIVEGSGQFFFKKNIVRRLNYLLSGRDQFKFVDFIHS